MPGILTGSATTGNFSFDGQNNRLARYREEPTSNRSGNRGVIFNIAVKYLPRPDVVVHDTIAVWCLSMQRRRPVVVAGKWAEVRADRM